MIQALLFFFSFPFCLCLYFIFKAMEELDGDDVRLSFNGRKAERDIVQVRFENKSVVCPASFCSIFPIHSIMIYLPLISFVPICSPLRQPFCCVPLLLSRPPSLFSTVLRFLLPPPFYTFVLLRPRLSCSGHLSPPGGCNSENKQDIKDGQ